MADGKVVKVVLQLENGQYVAMLQATGREHQAFSGLVTATSQAASGAVNKVSTALDGVATANKSAAGDQFIASLREQIAVSGKSTDELLRYQAARAGVAAQASPLILQLQNQRAAQQAAAETARAEEAAQREAAAAKQRAAGQQAAFLAGLREEVELQGKSHTEILRYRAAQMGVSGGAERYIQAIEAANKAHGRGAISAGQHAAAMRMLPAQMTDVVTSMASGMPIWMVAIQQGGQIKDSFGGAGNALRAMTGAITPAAVGFGLLAGTVGVAALAYYKGSAEADAYRESIVMSGNAAGTTVGRLTDMARAIAQVTGTQGAASAALAQMAGSGDIAAENLQHFAMVAMDLERYVGVPVKNVVADLEKLAEAPLAASIKLNQQYHYLTEAVYSHIKALDEQGKKEEAGAAAQRAYIAAFEARKNEIVANLGSIERGWNAVANAAKKGWDSILNIGREDTSQQKLDAISARIAQLRKAQEGNGFAETEGGAATGRGGAGAQARQKELDSLLAAQAALQENVRLEQRGAEAKAESARKTEAQAEWDKVVEANLSKQAKEAKEIEAIRRKGNAAGKEAAVIEKEIAAYKAKNADKGAANAATRELERQRGLLGELAGLSSSFYRDWEDLNKQFKDGKLTAEQLTQEQEKLLAKQPGIKAAREADLKVMQAQYAVQQQIADEIAQAEVARTQAVYAGRQAVTDYARGVGEATRLLEVERQTVTGTASQRGLAVEYLRIELELERQLEAIRTNTGFTQSDRDEEAARARATAAQARANATARAEIDHVRELRGELQRVTEQYEQGLTNAAMAGGKSLKEYVIGMLRTTAFRIALQPVMGAAASVLASATGTAGSTPGAGGLMGLVNSGSALYSALTNGVSSSIASAFGKFAGSSVGQTLGLSNPAAIVGNNPSAFVPAGGQLTSLGSSIGTGLGMLGSGFAGYGLSSAISGGYSTGGNTVNVLSGIASAFLGPVAGVVGGLINRAFGRKLKDVGIEGTLGGAEGFTGQSYQFYKGGWLRSDKTAYSDLDPATAGVLSNSFKAIQAEVGAFATALGLDTNKIATFTTALKLSTNGLDEAGIQKAFQEALAKGSNELAQQVLGTWTSTSEEVTRTMVSGMTDAMDGVMLSVTETITHSSYAASEYAKEGEEAIDTLRRLASSLAGVNGIFESMGTTLYQTGLAGADMASQLVDLLGGLENFTALASRYYEGYFSEAERVANTTRLLTRSFEALGLKLPETREQLRAIIESQDLSTEEGRKRYAELMKLTADFASITNDITNANEVMSKQRSSAYSALERAVSAEKKALQVRLDAAKDAANALQGVFDVLHSNVRDLRGEADATRAMLARQGNDFIVDALKNALANGALPDADQLAEAIAAARAGLDPSNFGGDSAERDYAANVLAGRLAGLERIAGRQLTDAQKTVRELETQTGQLDQTLEFWKQQIDITSGTYEGVLSVAAAVDRLSATLGTTGNTKPAVVTGGSGGGGVSGPGYRDRGTVPRATYGADEALTSFEKFEAWFQGLMTNAPTELLQSDSYQVPDWMRMAGFFGTGAQTDTFGTYLYLKNNPQFAADLQQIMTTGRSSLPTDGRTLVRSDLSKMPTDVAEYFKGDHNSLLSYEAMGLDPVLAYRLYKDGPEQYGLDIKRENFTEWLRTHKWTSNGIVESNNTLDTAKPYAGYNLTRYDTSTGNIVDLDGRIYAPGGKYLGTASRELMNSIYGAAFVGTAGGNYGDVTRSALYNQQVQGGATEADYYAAIKSGLDAAISGGQTAQDIANAISSTGASMRDVAAAYGISVAQLEANLRAGGATNIPAFAVGTNYVPRDTLALIHEGEAIVPKAYNPAANPGLFEGSGIDRLAALLESACAGIAQIKEAVWFTANLLQSVKNGSSLIVELAPD